MSRTKRKPPKSKPSFAIVADGGTEIWYLQMLKENEKESIRLDIKPELPKKSTLEESFEKVKKLSCSEYSRVIWIVDLDTIIKETKQTKKGKETVLQKFVKCHKQLDAKKYNHVTVIVNNPCLEFWFLLHYEKTSKYFKDYASLEKQLHKHMVDYEKTERFFKKKDNDIYLKLKPLLQTAITNSSCLKGFSETCTDEHQRAICEMNTFFDLDEIKNCTQKSNLTHNKGF